MAESRGKRRKNSVVNMESINKPAIKRLSYLGGCDNLSGLVYETIREVMLAEIRKFLKVSIIIAEHSRRKTLSLKDLKYAVKQFGYKLYGKEDSYEICKSLAELKKREGKCVVIAKLPFSKLVKAVSKEYNEEAKFSAIFMENFQYFIEHRMIHIFALSCKAAKNIAKRKTVFPKDIYFVVEQDCHMVKEPEIKLPAKKKRSKKE